MLRQPLLPPPLLDTRGRGLGEHEGECIPDLDLEEGGGRAWAGLALEEEGGGGIALEEEGGQVAGEEERPLLPGQGGASPRQHPRATVQGGLAKGSSWQNVRQAVRKMQVREGGGAMREGGRGWKGIGLGRGRRGGGLN